MIIDLGTTCAEVFIIRHIIKEQNPAFYKF